MAAARLLCAPHHPLKKRDGVSPGIGTVWLTAVNYTISFHHVRIKPLILLCNFNYRHTKPFPASTMSIPEPRNWRKNGFGARSSKA